MTVYDNAMTGQRKSSCTGLLRMHSMRLVARQDLDIRKLGTPGVKGIAENNNSTQIQSKSINNLRNLEQVHSALSARHASTASPTLFYTSVTSSRNIEVQSK